MNLAPLRNRDFGLLWVAGLISFTGDWALSVALPIAVYQLTGSAAATSALVAVNVGTRLLFGALAGVYVDRWDRRRVMIWANLLLAAALLPALAVDSADAVWILFGVVFAHSVLTSVVRPAEHALLPRLVGEADLAAANALNGLNNNLARLIGPALGGMVAATGPPPPPRTRHPRVGCAGNWPPAWPRSAGRPSCGRCSSRCSSPRSVRA